MPPAKLIALAGPVGCGKTTIAALLEQHNFARVRFAGPMKDMLSALGLSHDQLDGDKKETPCQLLCGTTPRHALQTLGTEWGRKLIGEDIWTNAAMQRIDWLRSAQRDIVVDDLRYEAQALLRRHAVIVGVRRSGLQHSAVHASEAGISPQFTTHYLDNDGTPEEALRALLFTIDY